MKIDDNFYMKLAIDEAWKYQLLTYPNPAVGCVVVKNGEILAIEAHKEAGKPHAEVNALKTAYLSKYPNDVLKTKSSSHDIHDYLIRNHNNFFEDCTIYVTLEPCNHIGRTPACANLLKELKPKRVVIAHEDINKEARGGCETLKSANIEVSIDCMKKEAYELLYPFIKWTQGTFIFYKMAQTLNGSIDGAISSHIAKAYVHTLRDKIDLMLIGGNTVRSDKPTLDARYIAGRAPNIMIYSKNKVFDTNIPLFKVPNREVIISDDLFKLLDYKFIMVEGTYNLMDKLKEKIDYLVLLVSPKIRKGVNALNDLDIDFKIVHENYIGEEKIIYLKRKG
ncbi:bifunctional diaminohydroxyphosphoribosylaminopyrimidine deaminase/5-amino-6-(5-phosphoribosylamino)uracil reductase RibD [Halarcobacter bivalviorum]|uniref:Riboflavin biosynthesis protein RibD n=1 Tax=Halarcobacter bivalviorum TaxID=663364 RepID=A0AAX2A7G5_9BACT|nr:bifunctional diaminohydroxyphosphoribosylaminopyrimidine deaminase/5-amino-6-(5-phosphoribosylamino)uracil reductase RibD [Halarcobacter bivalviorum]AXH13195.1 diaminohydroxyphosphoribosylaminopyrimidine deaminase / 5-amino-6-(5-phosphoribosylamino)uracil reductase [Halarcobacter bivalviorum]RXK10197.1 riboflavin biosynthesis protein RibD [Halarcobacter bivalviorum]